MATVTLNFEASINESASVGDLAYYTPSSSSGGFSVSNQEQLVLIGTILTINRSTNVITCDSTLNNVDLNGLGSVFILFVKDNLNNLSSMLGYYSQMKFVNDSQSESELFNVSVDVFTSSK